MTIKQQVMQGFPRRLKLWTLGYQLPTTYLVVGVVPFLPNLMAQMVCDTEPSVKLCLQHIKKNVACDWMKDL